MQKAVFFVISLVLLISCDSNQVFDQYKSIENNEWKSDNSIEFKVSVIDTINKHHIFVNLRNNNNYEFSNLFLRTKIQFPNNFNVIDTLEYEMTNANGEWLGEGFSDLKENKLTLKENVLFSEKGTYIFSIDQVMRKRNDVSGTQPLKGVIDVGLRIEKVKID